MPSANPPAPGLADAGATVRQVLLTLGAELVELVIAPAGLDAQVRDVAIHDPLDDVGARPGDLVLMVGLRGERAAAAVRAAGERGASAVAVRMSAFDNGDPLRAAASAGGAALLAVAPQARWEQVSTLVRGVVASARANVERGEGTALGDLFSLAQTIAAVTGGIVSIEDPAYRVLAYSRSTDDVDELRRLSILGQQGPEPYLKKLREWGVYTSLREAEQVVQVQPRPELGIRRRMAVGIHAGAEYLGTIWVQQGASEFEPDAAGALLGAARVAALHLIRRRSAAVGEPRLRENLLRRLLDGQVDGASVAADIGADPRLPAVVVAFALHAEAGAGAGAAAGDASAAELRHDQLAHLVSIHSAAYRRAALVTTVGARVYALLPELPAATASETALGLAREVVAAAHQRLRVRVRAGLGRPTSGFGQVPASRREADRVLDALARETEPTSVATFDDVRARVLLDDVLDLLAEHPRIRDERIDALVAYDARRGTDYAATLLTYLDAFGDVAAAARAAHVHPNTLRYRIRRASQIAGIDLDDAGQRLVAALQLRLGERAR